MGLYYDAITLAVRGLIGGVSGWRVEGAENVPLRGGVLVASNHISFWDPPLVGSALPRAAFYLAKEELFAHPLLGALLRSVHALPIRRGMGDLRGLSRALAVLRGGKALIMFPEGGRMRDGELHAARPGIGMIAVQADVPIVPCYVSGSNRPRRWLTRRLRPRLHVTFGGPRSWRQLAGAAAAEPPGRALYQAIGDGVMEEIGRLKATQLQTQAARGTAHQRRAESR